MKEYKTINFKVTPEEYEMIINNAKANNKSLVAYAKEVLINQAVLSFDYDSIDQHSKILTDLKDDLNFVLSTIANTGEAYSADIVRIQRTLKEILKTENEFQVQMYEDRKQLKKEVRKSVKKLVDKKINQEVKK